MRHYIDSSFSDTTTVDVPGEERLKDELAKRPDAVVVLDYTTFDIKSLAAVVNLRQRFPLSRWVMFSTELTQEVYASSRPRRA